MISDAKGGLYTGLKYLKENLCKQSEATYVVSTIHASKGLGFTKVVIGEDFLVPTMIEGFAYYDDAIEEMLQSNSMTSLLYVAITRSMKEVQLPSYLTEVIIN
jgi:superfamily I DNA/RNA helicase